jgi:hypothetical protein
MSTSPVIGGYLHQMINLLGYLQLNDLPPDYETCVMTSTLIEGYLQFYECSSELLKCVQKLKTSGIRSTMSLKMNTAVGSVQLDIIFNNHANIK